MLINKTEKRLMLVYALTTACIFCFFWAAYFFLTFEAAMLAALAMAFTFGVLFAIFNKTVWAATTFVLAASGGVGLAVGAFFVKSGLDASMFFGLVLAAMLAYKVLQAGVSCYIKRRRKLFFILCLVAELTACITVGILAKRNPSLLWQVFFALLLCFFYSCTQLTLKKRKQESLWRDAAVAYLCGFIFIFLLVVLLAISLAAEDGAPLELLFEGVGEGIVGSAEGKKKKQLL